MITLIETKNRDINGNAVFELRGKSTDTKPTVSFGGSTIGNGSSFFEIDTFKLFMYDGETGTWMTGDTEEV
ncbi:MAG: hypothetical protein IKP95_09430 [Ruminococcus sp.]|nr:hypothetical protein [Ruminococcus sp.]